MSRLSALLALALITGCGAPATDANHDGIADGVRVPDTVSVVAPSSPVGTVSGQIVNSKFQPLANATVNLVLGGKSDTSGSSYKATADADGNFAFKDVPAGATAQVTATSQGFSTVRTEITVPAAAGQFPLDDGNGNVGLLVLLELSGSVKFNILTPTGHPAKGIRGLLEVTPAGFRTTGAGSYGASLGVISGDTTADDNGVITFNNVPTPAEMTRVAGTYSLTLAAYDEDGDGRIDSNGSLNQYPGSTLFTRGTQTIILPDARVSTPLAVAATNIDSLAGGTSNPLRNYLRPSDSIYVAFNQAVAEQSIVVKVVGEDCAAASSVAVTRVLRSGTVLVISPPASGWVSGKEYNLAVRATALESGSLFSRSAFFFGADPTAPIPVGGGAAMQYRKAPGSMSTSELQTGDELYVLLDSPVRWVNSTAQARAFFNFDLNNNGSIGNGTGDYAEYGAPFATGFLVTPAEITSDPTGTFACTASGYTSRFRITYAGLPASGVPANTELKVTFPRDVSTTDGYQSIWGLPYVGDVTGRLVNIP